MTEDLHELETLAATWRAESPTVPAGLARMVKRQGIWLRLHLALALLTSVVFLAGSVWAALRFASIEFYILAVGVWVITIGTLAFQIRNRASTWTPHSHTTDEFIALSVRRCRSGLRGIRFGLWLVFVQVVFVGSWHVWYWSSRPQRPPLTNWLIAALFPLAFLVGLLCLRAYRLKQLAHLERIQRELSE